MIHYFDIKSSIIQSKIDYKPFKHIHINNLFPSRLYNYILRNWPNINNTRSIGSVRNYNENNTHWGLRRNAHASEINYIWNRIDKIISPQIKFAIEKKFQVSALKHEMLLTVDDPMFKIGLHNDNKTNFVVILLMYFPFGEESGTNLHYENKEVAKYIPSLSNTAFAFMPSEKTWHSVPESLNPRHKITFRLFN